MVELTPDQADRQKEVTLMHLTDIDRYSKTLKTLE